MQQTSLIQSLNHLPCFSNITHVTSLDSGFSQPCYKVTTSEKNYFVKSNPFSSLLALTLNQLAAKNGLSPAIIYQDDNWLVTDFIEGQHLDEYCNEGLIDDFESFNTKRIQSAVNLMVKCHKLPITAELQITNSSPEYLNGNLNNTLIGIESLNCLKLCNNLIELTNFPVEKVAKLARFALLSDNHLQSVLTQINECNPQKQLVGCHGDINFSNVIIASDNTPWLIDFECASLAPAEFDMAMFIAINTLSEHETSEALKAYQKTSNHPLLDETLTQAYLPLCYLINALWYDNASRLHPNAKTLKIKSEQQWQLINWL